METHQLADEIDILRDKGAKLLKAEQTIEKYSKKLEEMLALKKQNKEANDKLDAYLDQIHELESANKGKLLRGGWNWWMLSVCVRGCCWLLLVSGVC